MMTIQVIWLDLATLFKGSPDGEQEVFADVPDAFEFWRSNGLSVAGITTDAQRYGSSISSALGDAFPVIERTLAQWRQTQTWLDLVEKRNTKPERIVFVGSSSVLIDGARRAGLRTLGVMRNPYTMAVLEGFWVDTLSAVSWTDLAEGGAL